jgi:hypothetical protein
VLAFSTLFYFAPLMMLGGLHSATPSTLEQQQQVATLMLRLYSQGFNLSFVFFGVYCPLIGYLVLKSAFLPRALGIGMMLAGLGWLTFISPSFARSLYPYVMLGGIGEATLTIWLIAFGVNRERWNSRAALA